MRAAVLPACFTAALLLAGSAAAQATPETPGPAGAEAAVLALIEAQRVPDWPALLRLTDPDEVSEAAALTRYVAGSLRGVLADSAEAARSGASVEDAEAFQYAMDAEAPVRQAARRLGAILPPGEAISAEALLLRVLDAARARNPAEWSLPPGEETSGFSILGSVVERDSLVHIVGRITAGPSGRDAGGPVETLSMRWVGGRWALTLPDTSYGRALGMATLFDNWQDVIQSAIEEKRVVSAGAGHDDPQRDVPVDNE